jgi:[ribosomal protein S18]-alanine N-acetyltransferase
MDERFELTALRLAHLVNARSRSPQARQLAEELLQMCEPIEIPESDARAPLAADFKPVKREPAKCHIRWLIRRDMPEVLEIENSSFEFPWSEKDFIRQLRQRNCIGMVAEFQERVAGFVIYELHKVRLHLVNLAVHREFRHRTVAAQLIDKLQKKLCPQRRRRISCYVRETNVDAQLFFRAFGFRAVGISQGIFKGTDEDAYRMQYLFPSAKGTNR